MARTDDPSRPVNRRVESHPTRRRTVLSIGLWALVLGAAIGVAIWAPAARAGAAKALIPNPDSLDFSTDLSGLDLEQVRLHRHALLARHCRFLQDPFAQRDYAAYQQRKCGYTYQEFDREEPGKAIPMDPGAEAFLSRLEEREQELRAGRIRVQEGRTIYDPAAIANRSQFAQLPDSIFARLLRDGCVALPAGRRQLFEVYEQNDYLLLPSFITTDLMLQVHHLYFDYTLRALEEERLLPAARELCTGMRSRLAARAARSPGATGDAMSPLERAALYFAVADGLCATDSIWSPPEGIDPRRSRLLAAQAELILRADTLAQGPIMGTVDYTMFRPRGHYTRSPELTRYFRVMMWLGLPGFILKETIMPVEAALAVAWELVRDPALLARYEKIYQPTTFYVGPSDDISPRLVAAVADSLCGAGASLEQWSQRKEEIRAELIRRDPTRIRTEFLDDRDLPQLRLLGQRYIPDSEVFQRLTAPIVRPMPTGLDLFGALGVPRALELLRASPIEWTDYWPQMARVQSDLREIPPAGTPDNLYWRWFHLLRTLNRPPLPTAPAAMRTRAWEVKNLNAGLASWAELRHDTILYAKQSGSAECGGGEIPPRIVGYVEARPDVFGEMRALTAYTRQELAARDLLSSRHRELALRLEEMLAFLERVSRAELAGESLSDIDLTEIRIFGSQVEYLTLELLAGRVASWGDLYGPDRRVAVVADVHSASSEALEVAVGGADDLLVLLDLEGDLRIARGAIFSYYEFKVRREDRLSDEQWHDLLDRGAAPPRPAWMFELLHPWPAPLPEPPARYIYSSGC